LLPLNYSRADLLSRLEGVSFGDEVFSSPFGKLNLGHLVFLHGTQRCLALSELLCVQAQLALKEGGLESKAIFIDGGNTFDPCLIAEYAEQLSLDSDKVLENVLVSRAFTYHQLTSLIANNLKPWIDRLNIKLAVISNILEPYCDPDIARKQSSIFFKVALNSLVSTIREKKIVAIGTSLDDQYVRRNSFFEQIAYHSNIIAKLEDHGDSTIVILEKHFANPPAILLNGCGKAPFNNKSSKSSFPMIEGTFLAS